MAGHDYESQVIQAFQHRGWAVVHLSTHASVRQPNEQAIADANRRRQQRIDELLAQWGVTTHRGIAGGYAAYAAAHLRAAEQARAEIPEPPTGFEPASDTDDDIDAAARRIAAAVDQSIAEHAYAAAAAAEYISQIRPDWADLPVAVIGFSAGAFAAPAAAVRLGDRVCAVILVGGADLFRISQTSTETNGGIRLAPRGERPDPRLVKRLDERYLAHGARPTRAASPVTARRRGRPGSSQGARAWSI